MSLKRDISVSKGPIVGDSKLKTGINSVLTQLAIFGIPLIVTPYVISTVGMEHYGAYCFMQAIIGIVAVFVQYGFVQAGVRDIAACTGEVEISREFSVIFFSKTLMMFVGLFVAIGLLFLPRFHQDGWLYIFCITGLLTALLDTGFVYQGIEKMKVFMVINLTGGLLSMALVFVFLHTPKDYIWLPLFFNLPRSISFLAGIWILRNKFSIKLQRIPLKSIHNKLQKGFNFFVTNVLILGYTRIHFVILGLRATSSAVGYFAIADQIIVAYMSLQGMATAGFHAQIVKELDKKEVNESIEAKKAFVVTSVIALLGIIYTFYFAEDIGRIFVKHGEVTPLLFSLKLMSLNFITIGLGSLIVIQVLLTINQERYLLYFSIVAAFLSIPFCWWITPIIQQAGAAITVFVVNLCGLPWVWFAARRHGFRFVNVPELMRLLIIITITCIIFAVIKWCAVFIGLYAGWMTLLVTGPLCTILYIGILLLAGIVKVNGRNITMELMPS